MDSDSSSEAEFEKHITGSQLLSITDIQRPMIMLCLLDAPDGTGSGFLAQLDGYKFILTNHHVIPNVKIAATNRAFFDYQDSTYKITDLSNKGITLDPDSFFFTSPVEDLDFTAVGYRDAGFTIYARESRCYDLTSHSTNIKIGTSVEIYQHPNGKPIRKSVGTIAIINGPYIKYNATTDYGSSGGLVLDGNMMLIGLHHQRVPTQELNKGILISEIVNNLRKQMEAKKLSGQAIGKPSIYALDVELTFFAEYFSLVLTPEKAEEIMKRYLKDQQKSMRSARVMNIQRVGLFSAQTISKVERRRIVAKSGRSYIPIARENVQGEVPDLWSFNVSDSPSKSIYIPINLKSKLIPCLKCHGAQHVTERDSSWGTRECDVCAGTEKLEYYLELQIDSDIAIRVNKRIFVPQVENYPEKLIEAVRSSRDHEKLFEIGDTSITEDDFKEYNLPTCVVDSIVKRLSDVASESLQRHHDPQNSNGEIQLRWQDLMVTVIPIYIISYQESSQIAKVDNLWLVGSDDKNVIN